MSFFSKIFKSIAPVALPILGTFLAPGIGTALGVGTAAGGAIGGGLGGALGGALTGGGVGGALKGAALGAAGGYLSSGGLSSLLDTTGLSTGALFGGSAGEATSAADRAISAARAGVSSAATSAVPSTSFLSNYLPSVSSGVSGGGTSGGFLSGLSDFLSPTASSGVASGFGGVPGAVGTSFSGVPGALETSFSGIPGATTGATSMLDTSKLIPGLAKAGLTAAFTRDNTGGYNAVQGAANTAAAGYQPFLASGTGATRTLSDLYGINGADAAAAAAHNWENTPGYQFARDQGIKALDASAASRGMLRSGNQEQAVQSFGTGLADQYYQQYLQNLMAQQGVGLNAAGGYGQNTVDAATAYALMKQANANRANQLAGTLSGFL